MKIGRTVGYPSCHGQCDHEPLRLTAYHLAVTKHVVGELPELAFRSCGLPSEDSLHRGAGEWHRRGVAAAKAKAHQQGAWGENDGSNRSDQVIT